jgi:hypothetical protein
MTLGKLAKFLKEMAKRSLIVLKNAKQGPVVGSINRRAPAYDLSLLHTLYI